MDLSPRLSSLSCIAIAALFLAAGCAPAFAPLATDATLTKDLHDGLGCKDVRSKVFDAYYHAVDAKTLIAGAKQLSEAAFTSDTSPETKLAIQAIHGLITNFMSRVSTTSIDAALGSLNADEGREPILKLIRLEMRSELDPEIVITNQKLDAALKSAHEQAVAAGSPCATPPPSSDDQGPPKQNPFSSRWPASLAAAHLTMATAYQSCQSLTLPPLTSAVQDLVGIRKAVKIDNEGWGRAYTDVARLKQTDYYLHGQTYPAGCLNQDAKPLVYDYSGVPVIKSSTLLSLFENSGGGPALGIDCSAFISTAVGVAGHRYKEGVANKPVYTRFASVDFIDPKKSGWSCFDPVSVSTKSSLAPGDIGAVVGHIVMVDSVGADPFGLAKIHDPSQCSSLDFRNFDFTLIQSASTKAGIGINRYIARDYLKETSKITELFTAYAKATCLNKFDGKTRLANTSTFGLIRHKDTPNCLAPNIKLVGQSCVESCVQ